MNVIKWLLLAVAGSANSLDFTELMTEETSAEAGKGHGWDARNELHHILIESCLNQSISRKYSQEECFWLTIGNMSCIETQLRQSVIEIKVQQNSGQNLKLASPEDLMVSIGSQPCQFDGFDLLEMSSSSEPSTGSSNHFRFEEGHLLLTDTTNTNADFKTIVYDVELWPFIRFGVDSTQKAKYAHPIKYRVKVGCYTVARIAARPNSGHLNFMQTGDKLLQVVIPKYKILINVLDLISLETDVPGCGAYQITSFADSSFTMLTDAKSKSRLVRNLLTRSDEGVWNPKLIFDYDRNSNEAEQVYLRIESDTLPGQSPAALDLIISANFCTALVTAKEEIQISRSPANQAVIKIGDHFEHSFSHQACSGLSFFVSGSSDVPPNDPSFTPLKHQDVSLNRSHLHVSPSEDLESFFLWAITAEGRSAATKVILEPKKQGRRLQSICAGENLAPQYPSNVSPEFMGFTRLQGNKQVYALSTFLTTLRTTMFTAPTDTTNCQISRFYVSDTTTTTEVTTGNIYTYLLWNARATTGQAITVNTGILTYSLVLDFRIQVVLGTGANEFLNPQSYSIQLKIGCFKETSNSKVATLYTGASTYYQPLYSNATNIHLEVPPVTAPTSIQDNLKNYFLVLSTGQLCGFYKATFYSDPALTTIAASPLAIYPLVSPSYRIESTGVLDMKLVINYDQTTTSFPPLYMKIETQESKLGLGDIQTMTFSITTGFCSQNWLTKQATPIVVSTQTSTTLSHGSSTYFIISKVPVNCYKNSYQVFNQDYTPATDGVIFFTAPINGGINFLSPVAINKIYIVRVTNNNIGVPAPGPANEQQIQVIINWPTTLCSTQNLLPKYPVGKTEFEIIVQKNSGDQPFAFEFTNTYFTAPTNVYCMINDWRVSDTTVNTVLPATDPMFPYFAAVTGLNTTQVKVNSIMTTDGYLQLTARVWPKIGEGTANRLNPTAAMLKFSIGCIVPPIIAEVSGQTNPYFSSLTSTKASFVVPKPLAGTSTISITLNQVIDFKTNDTYCKVQKLTSFSEAGGVYTITDSTSETKLVTNPIIRTAGALNPMLEVITDSSKTSIRSVFIKAETEGIAGANIGVSQFELSFAYCDVTPLLSQAELKFNMIRGEKAQKVTITSLYTMPASSAACNGVDLLLSTTDSSYTQTTVEGVTLAAPDLEVNPTTVMQTTTFYVLIRSTTSGKQVAVKVLLTVKDCKSEVLTPSKTTLSYSHNQTSLLQLLTKTEIVDLFSAPVDSRCAITDWQLSTVDSADKIVGGEYYDMFALSAKKAGVDDLNFDASKNILKQVEIKVRLWVVIGSTALSLRLIEAPVSIVVLQPQYAVTSPPVFKQTPITLLKVKATRDAEGNLKESPSISFPSPLIEDPIGLAILIDAKWIGKTPDFASVVTKTNIFEIVVDCKKIGESGTYSLSVQLGNEKFKTSEQTPTIITLAVTFQQDRQQAIVQNQSLQNEQPKQPEQTTPSAAIKTEVKPENKPEVKVESQPKPSALSEAPPIQTNNKPEKEASKPKEEQQLPEANENELVPIVQVPVQRGGVAKQPKKPAEQQAVPQEYIDEVMGRWKQKTTKNQDKKSFLPLILSSSFNREGVMVIKSNQKMMPPPFVNQAIDVNTNKRGLIEMSEIDVTRDLFDIEFDFYDLAAEEKVEYSVLLSNWTANEVTLKFNFTNPNLVSKGLKQDKVFVKTKDPELFRSAESGEAIDETSKEMVTIVPTLLPFGIKAESLASVVTTSQGSLFAIMILQVVMQFFLKQSLEQILTFYITLQQMTYVIYFNIKIAAPVEMFLLEFQKLIEFQNLNMDSIIQIWYPEFSLNDWVQGYKERIVSEEQGMSILKQLQVFVLAVIVYGLVILIMWIASRYREKIKQKLKATLKSTFWNGSILSFDMQCMADCIVVGNQIRMITTHSEFLKQEEVDAALGLFCFLNAVVVFMICYLLWNRNKLDSKEIKEKCGRLYILPLRRSKYMALLRLPFSVLQRLIYMVLAGAFYEQPYFSLQLYVFLNLCHTMYRINYKLDAPLSKRFQQHFSDVVVHFMFLMLFLFTDFVTLDESQMLFSLIYMGLFGIISFVNVIFIGYHGVKAYLLRRKRDRILKLMKTRILTMQNLNLNGDKKEGASIDIFQALQKRIKENSAKRLQEDELAPIKLALKKLNKAKTAEAKSQKLTKQVHILEMKLEDISQDKSEEWVADVSTSIYKSEVKRKTSSPSMRINFLENEIKNKMRSQVSKSFFHRSSSINAANFQLKIIKK